MNLEKEKRKNLSSELIQIVSFFLGGDEYGIHIGDIQEIVKLPVIRRLPKTSNFLKGVINLRGNIVPVIDMRQRFDMEQVEYGENTRVIILNIEDTSVGTIVDSISRVQVIERDDIEEPPDIICGLSKEYIEGIGKIDKRMIVILKIAKILTDEEFRTITKVTKETSQSNDAEVKKAG